MVGLNGELRLMDFFTFAVAMTIKLDRWVIIEAWQGYLILKRRTRRFDLEDSRRNARRVVRRYWAGRVLYVVWGSIT